jgi:PhoH-like ATPase
LHPNQYIMLVSNQNEKKTALARYISKRSAPQKIMQFRKGIWGIKSRNKEQMFAMDMLLNPEIQVVSLIGKAGSGKTLCAIAAGLEQSYGIWKRGTDLQKVDCFSPSPTSG